MRVYAAALMVLGVACSLPLAEPAGANAADRSVAGDTSAFKGVQGMETATFAAGCFWHVEEAFRRVEGVKATSVGYTGGHKEEPTYREVCTGTTGHAEAVEVVYEPETVSYEKLLEVFWKVHNPTQKDRQGPDVGHQYRSAIFCHTPDQEKAARASMKALGESGQYRQPIVTEIVGAQTFWRAEEYHQQYFKKNGRSHCPR